ncbi:hypothetical protein NIES2104_48800 [Leptolyngbya sp. NIES-2104]|nr:hypothetical protein NIES2104_48800 [Leptolyngbya sp. NIES-2104]
MLESSNCPRLINSASVMSVPRFAIQVLLPATVQNFIGLKSELM